MSNISTGATKFSSVRGTGISDLMTLPTGCGGKRYGASGTACPSSYPAPNYVPCSAANSPQVQLKSVVRTRCRLTFTVGTTDAEGQYVIIGDVRVPQGKPSHPELVPVGYLEATASSQFALQHLRWLMQKGLLRQDMFLLGPPGPLRRRIALSYCEVTCVQSTAGSHHPAHKAGS